MGDGGRVEKGEAKKAFVLEVEEESEIEDGIMSENVDDNDEALESDDLDRENGATFSVVAVIVAEQIRVYVICDSDMKKYPLVTHTCLYQTFLIIEGVVLQRQRLVVS